MAAAARRYDFDLVLAANFGGSGEVVETVASHLASLAGRSWRIGLWRLAEPSRPVAALSPRIAAFARNHTAVPIPPDASGIRSRLVLIYEPSLLALPDALTACVRADWGLVVLVQAPANRNGPVFDVTLAAARIDASIARRQLWCPTSPAIRARLLERGSGLPVRTEDLPPLEPLSSWRVRRRAPEGRRAILGRMLRRDDERLPDQRDALLLAYPGATDLEMRFLGGAEALAKRIQPFPRDWQLEPEDSTGVRRFLARLDFYVQQQDERASTPPRGTLQAMAAGRVVIAGPACQVALGAGPAYRDPDQVADTARYLHAEPKFYERYLAEQDAALAARFGPRQLLDLLADFLPVPKARARPIEAKSRPVIFYPTNGIGLGHVTRSLAIARRLPASLEAVFLTPCHALSVIEHAGFRAEYVPEAAYDETNPTDHAAAMVPRLGLMLRHYEPAAIVFDGNVPRDFLLAACADVVAPLIWVRRGMWRADASLGRHLEHSRRFDAVIEPGEAAAAADRGVTAAAEDAPLAVPPVMLLDRTELERSRQARAALGLAEDRPAVLVQLGAGNNNDIDGALDRVAEAQARLGLQVVVAEWLIQQVPLRRSGLRYLASFPNARHFPAFDFAVSAAGYNSFHELLHHGVPTIFVPNDNQKVDDQRARAEWAEVHGAAICLPRGAETSLPGYMSALLDPELRRQLARRARAACPSNGAAAAAAAISAMAERG